MQTLDAICANLLYQASRFYRDVAEQNAEVASGMRENAEVYEQLSILLRDDPTQNLGDQAIRVIAVELLLESAKFFRAIHVADEQTRKSMDGNAEVYEDAATRLREIA